MSSINQLLTIKPSTDTTPQRYCHVQADKKYQLADWRVRPLPSEVRTSMDV